MTVNKNIYKENLVSGHSLYIKALNYRKYSTVSDVWSFGCHMYEIWSLGHKPFEGYTNMEVNSFN